MTTNRWVRDAAALSARTCRLSLLLAALIVAALGVVASIGAILTRSPERVYLPSTRSTQRPQR